MGCEVCDNTGWVCENHRERPWGSFSTRSDACECGAGAPCVCNPGDDGKLPEMPKDFEPIPEKMN